MQRWGRGRMKKYWGKGEWSESIYLYDVYDQNSIDKNGDPIEGMERTQFFLGFKFDFEHTLGFPDNNAFEDMNMFITYSEEFNVYQKGKI